MNFQQMLFVPGVEIGNVARVFAWIEEFLLE